ncbi:MAG: hypothetical protein QCI00_08535 [Candidatus Thermoplasmatota archaeon]|nr:hypothetical protein [Candidatus Thermoplasmatota archaeon]
MRCDNCGSTFGFLEDGNKLPTQNIFEVPQIYCNKCFEQWREEHKKILTDIENPIYKENMKLLCEMPKTKFLGTILILFAFYFTIVNIFLLWGEIYEYLILIILFSYIIGIALLVVKKKDIFHMLIVIGGIIVLGFHILFILMAAVLMILV